MNEFSFVADHSSSVSMLCGGVKRVRISIVSSSRRLSIQSEAGLRLGKPADALLTETEERWRSLVTEERAHELLHDGFSVVRDAIPHAFTRHVRDEIKFLHSQGQLYSNSTHIMLPSEPQPMLLQKHHILETELVLPEIRAQVPALKWFFDSQLVFHALLGALPPWLALSGSMIKLQYNEGHGGCFPMHFDSYGGSEDGKCITAVLYLNEDWQDGDGGEIVLYPFPRGQKPVVVRPLDGDIVLFSSQQMLHRVMPATRPRYCLTTWIYQNLLGDAQDPAASLAHQQHKNRIDRDAFYGSTIDGFALNASDPVLSMLDKIMRSSFRRHLAKLYYRDEWTRSLQESHHHTDAFGKYMGTHMREMEVISKATSEMLYKFAAKQDFAVLPTTAAELFQLMLDDPSCRRFLSQFPMRWF